MKKFRKDENITGQSTFYLLSMLIIITFLSLLYAFNVSLEVKSFNEYKYSIRSIENCTPLGGNHPPVSCEKTDIDLLNDYRRIRYLPLSIALVTLSAYFLIKRKRKFEYNQLKSERKNFQR